MNLIWDIWYILWTFETPIVAITHETQLTDLLLTPLPWGKNDLVRNGALVIVQELNYNNFNASHKRGYAIRSATSSDGKKRLWKILADSLAIRTLLGELQLLSTSLMPWKIKRYGWSFEREIDIPVVAKLSSNVATRWLLRRVKLHLKGVGKSSLSSTRINSLGGSSKRDKSPQQISG